MLFDLAANAILFDGGLGNCGPLLSLYLSADAFQQFLSFTLEVFNILESVDEDNEVNV